MIISYSKSMLNSTWCFFFCRFVSAVFQATDRVTDVKKFVLRVLLQIDNNLLPRFTCTCYPVCFNLFICLCLCDTDNLLFDPRYSDTWQFRWYEHIQSLTRVTLMWRNRCSCHTEITYSRRHKALTIRSDLWIICQFVWNFWLFFVAFSKEKQSVSIESHCCQC